MKAFKVETLSLHRTPQGSPHSFDSGPATAIAGFAFKKDTGDTRETPAVDVICGLLEDRANVTVYDPQACTSMPQ